MSTVRLHFVRVEGVGWGVGISCALCPSGRWFVCLLRAACVFMVVAGGQVSGGGSSGRLSLSTRVCGDADAV